MVAGVTTLPRLHSHNQFFLPWQFSQLQLQIFNFVFRSNSLHSLTPVAAQYAACQVQSSTIGDINLRSRKSSLVWAVLPRACYKQGIHIPSRLHSHTTAAEAQPEHAGYSAPQEDLRFEPETAAATIAF